MSEKKKIELERYMASLNQDRFFKKVFENLKIAKSFLEDFLDVEIQEIEKLEKDKHYITDDAKYVEFDFRCKIDNAYVIIDMQQWYKPDVIHRFYTYHSLNTALQLETLPLKKIIKDSITNEELEVKDYRRIDPVVTLVWMVDDSLRHDGDFLSFSMTHDSVINFVNNNTLWLRKDINELILERDKIIKELKNNSKNLDFIPRNKLIFACQKNIIKNPKHEKYFNWFKFAELSSKKNNKKSDFKELKEDDTFKENCLYMEKRLSKEELSEEEKKFITSEELHDQQVQKWMDDERDYIKIGFENDIAMLHYDAEVDKRKLEEEKVKTEEANKKTEEAKRKAEEEKVKTEEANKKAEEEKRKAEEEKRKAEEEKRKAEGTIYKAAELLSKSLNISIEEAISKINT